MFFSKSEFLFWWITKSNACWQTVQIIKQLMVANQSKFFLVTQFSPSEITLLDSLKLLMLRTQVRWNFFDVILSFRHIFRSQSYFSACCGHNNWIIFTIPVIFCSTRAMKCSMDELKFAATWKSSGIQGAKFSIKVIFKTFSNLVYSFIITSYCTQTRFSTTVSKQLT